MVRKRVCAPSIVTLTQSADSRHSILCPSCLYVSRSFWFESLFDLSFARFVYWPSRSLPPPLSISPRPASMSGLLSRLSDEIFALLVPLIGSVGVGRLWLSGNVGLQSRMLHSQVVRELEIALSVRRPRWPSLVSQFAHLEVLSVSCQVYSTCTFVSRVSVDSIPKSVRHLRLKFANDFVSFFEVDPDSCDVDYYNSDGFRLRDMSALLPHLETFEFLGTVTHLDLQREFPSLLPRTLLALRLPERYAISPPMISLLPKTLRDLEITLEPTAEDAWDDHDICFPPDLTSFTCHELRSLMIIKLLPSSLTQLTFAPFDSEDPLEQDALYAFLPDGLLSLDTPLISHFDERFAKFLPRTLKRLNCGFSTFTPKAVKHLPRTLEFWDAKTSLFQSVDMLLWSWKDVPPTLQHMPLEALKKIDIGIEEEWSQMPRGLENFTLPLSAFDDIASPYLSHLPQNITQLTVWDGRKSLLLLSPVPQNWCKSLNTLDLNLLYSDHPLLHETHFIRDCCHLKTLKLIISQHDAKGTVYDTFYAEALPDSLSSLHSMLNCNLYSVNFAQPLLAQKVCPPSVLGQPACRDHSLIRRE